MDLNDLFDVPKIKLKQAVVPTSATAAPVKLTDLADRIAQSEPIPTIEPDAPRHVHVDLAVKPEPKPKPVPTADISSAVIAEVLDADLDINIADRAKAAADAHDTVARAKAALDEESARIREELDKRLVELTAALRVAQEEKRAAMDSLQVAMEKGNITSIPMTDRPDIIIKTTKGSKKGITRGWLVDPENLAVKAYEEALAGEPTILSGKDFAGKVWNAQPKSGGTSRVIVPNVYEDEPDC